MKLWAIFLICGFMSKVHSEGESSKLQGCATANQAQNLNEEIVRMLEASPYVELVTALMNNVESEALDKVEKCLKNVKVLYEFAKMAMEMVGQDGSVAMRQYEAFKKIQMTGFKNVYDRLLTPFIQDAERIEAAITEGNAKRLLQLDVVSQYRDIWMDLRRIRLDHEKTVQSLDPYLKDTVMQKTAEIGQYIRKGNAGNKWTVVGIKEEFEKLQEVQNINKLIPVYGTAFVDMSTILNEFLNNYLSSQLELAVYRSKLENSIGAAFQGHHRQIVERIESCSELSTSKSIKEATEIHRDCLSVGYKEAESYATSVNSTVDKLRKAFAQLESVTGSLGCQKVIEIELASASMFLGVFRVIHQFGPLVSAGAYKEKIDKFYDTIQSAMNTQSIKSPLQFILKCVPSSRNGEIEEAYNYLDQFVTSPLGGADITRVNTTLERVSVYVNKLKEAFRCQRKIFQFIGNIVQSCKDGRGSFDDLYTNHRSKADIDSTMCTDLALIDIPTKQRIQQLVITAASTLGFKADCQQNQQKDDPDVTFYDDHYDYDDDDSFGSRDRLSPTQRFTVCNLRRISKTTSVIAGMIKMSERLVGAVRCKQA